jgi:hypothetical protein
MRPEPLGEDVCSAIREERDRLTTLQINQHSAIRLAFPQREVIHTKDRRSRERRGRQPTQQAQQRIPAHYQLPTLTQLHPSLTP